MITTNNIYNPSAAPCITLCNPSSEARIKDGRTLLSDTLGLLPDCSKVTLTANFNAPWELSFNFYDNPDSSIHKMYTSLVKGRFVFLEDIGFFIIDSCDITDNAADGTFKSVVCRSADTELKNAECPIVNEGNYVFFDDSEDNLTGIIVTAMQKCPKWTLGFVDDGLKQKSAYWDAENSSENAYDFLWEKIETAYECIIDADIIKRKLNFYSVEYYAAHHSTDIHLSRANDLKGIKIETGDDDLFTAISVNQSDQFSITYANPAGGETLYNFDSFLDMMSPELKSAVFKHKEKFNACKQPYRALTRQYMTARDELNEYESNTAILKDNLNNCLIQRDKVISLNESDDSKNIALENINRRIAELNTQISESETAVQNKKAEIQNTYEQPIQTYTDECSLSLTAKDVNGNPIFTQSLLNELAAYIRPAEYTDEYITVTSDMTNLQIFEQSAKLFDRAYSQLLKISSPSLEFTVENNSFLFNKKFSRFSKQLMPGVVVWLETSDDCMEQVHLTAINVNYENGSVNLTFSSKYARSDIFSLFNDVFGNIKSGAAQLKYLKNVVNDQRSLLEKQKDWIDNALTLTKEHALTSNHQTVVIDDSGYLGRKLLLDRDGNIQYDTNNNILYQPEQLKIINNGMYLTTDNWRSISTAVGKIYLYHDEENDTDVFKYGVAGDLIIGKMFLGKELSLIASPRSDGTYAITLNQNGLTVINDGTSAGITIKDAAGNKQFYADSDGNLCLSGNINAIGGKIGGYTIDEHFLYNHNDYGSAGIGEYPYGWAFWAGTDNGDHTGGNAEFKVGHDGSLYAKKGTVAGWNISDSRIYNTSSKGCTVSLWNPGIAGGDIISASIGDYYPFRVDINGKLYARDADIEGHINATSGSFTGTVNAGKGHIGGWDIVDNWLSCDKETFSITLCDNGVIYTGGASPHSTSWLSIIDAGKLTSDKNLKNNIKLLSSHADTFFDSLLPVSFSYKPEALAGDTSAIHFGFIAQDVEVAYKKAGFKKLAMVWQEENYNLNKQEIIALNTWQIQLLKQRIKTLEDILNSK